MRNRSRVVLRAATATTILLTGSAAMAAVYYAPVTTLVGDGGATTLGSAGALTTIQVYQDGVANQSSPVAQASYAQTTAGLQTSGSSATEGQLANNPTVADNAAIAAPTSSTAYVFSPGYAAAQDAANVINAAAANPRVVGYMTVTANSVSGATIGSNATSASTFSGGNIRGAVGSDTAGTLFSAGSNNGYHYMPTGTGVTSVALNANTPGNTRQVEIRNGQLYGSSDTGTYVGIQAIGSGTPTTTGTTSTASIVLTTNASSSDASPEGFVMLNDTGKATPSSDGAVSGFSAVPYNVIYVADAETGTVANLEGPGIEKWVYNTANRANGDGGWSLAYTIADKSIVAGVASPMISLAGQEDGNGNVLLYGATQVLSGTSNGTTTGTGTGSNKLLEFTDSIDTGTAITTDASEVVLATSATNQDFRGVALAPAVPEPATLSVLTLGLAGLISRRRRA